MAMEYISLKYVKDERAVTAVEYAIIAVALSALILAVFGGSDSVLRGAIDSAMTNIKANMTSANTSQ
ncbi:fimbrial protein [Photobacterium proteolyticum]|uniref:Fimbrial protein n=1 Tax=Photobacterium proteolyticum TaxID=1903952 RepID=A0A1Q9H1K0_9GAMM|nr:fimbrial protein [Photobacterium proteolyticum]